MEGHGVRQQILEITSQFAEPLGFAPYVAFAGVVDLALDAELIEDVLAGTREMLANVAKLKCDMYDNALLPVALVNKLVSLADHPSSKILQKFAIECLEG